MEYQGWKNIKTWCAVTTVANDEKLHDTAVMICSGSDPKVAEISMKRFFQYHEETFSQQSAWHTSGEVDLSEVVDHFRTAHAEWALRAGKAELSSHRPTLIKVLMKDFEKAFPDTNRQTKADLYIKLSLLDEVDLKLLASQVEK